MDTLLNLLGLYAIPVVVLLIVVAFTRGLVGAARAARRAALSDLEGRHYQYRTIPLKVVEHEGASRWVRTDGVRRVIPALPPDARLRHLFPDDVTSTRAGSSAWIRANGLHALLEKSQNADSIRFRNWLQREVIFPGQRARERGPRAVPGSLPHSGDEGPVTGPRSSR